MYILYQLYQQQLTIKDTTISGLLQNSLFPDLKMDKYNGH